MAAVDLAAGRISFHQLPQVGRGPAQDVVMVHGLGANFGFWYASAVQWFRRFGCVTLLDLPGHGASDMPTTGYAPADMAQALGELLDHLGIARAHLVAHSFGGSVALAFAVRQPERVQSLVLADVRLWTVEPPVAPDPSAPWLQKLRGAGLALDEAGLDPSVQVLVELAQQRLVQDDPDAVVSDALPGARSLFPGKRAARKWLKLIETTRAYDEMTDPGAVTLAEVAQLTQPMLAVYGGLSTRKRSALALQRVCPQSRLHVIPDVGHFFPLTRPRLFARPAMAFLRSIVRDRPAARRRRLPTFRDEVVDPLRAAPPAPAEPPAEPEIVPSPAGTTRLPHPVGASSARPARSGTAPGGIAPPHIVH